MEWICNPDCKGGCCGIVPFALYFASANRDKYQVEIKERVEDGGVVLLITDDKKCVFLNRENFRCEVYEDRPTICRMFGQVPGLLCAYTRMDGTPRKPHETKFVARKMDAMFDKRLAKVMK